MDDVVGAVTVEERIRLIRGVRVMLDADLAELYGVTTKRLNEQVKRNRERFPDDFMFRLSESEAEHLRSQIATSSGWGGRRTRPLAFTEHGAVMLASVLSSPTAVLASIQVVRTFVRLREAVTAHRDLARRLEELEARYDDQFRVVFDAIRALMQPPPAPARRPRVGFSVQAEGGA